MTTLTLQDRSEISSATELIDFHYVYENFPSLFTPAHDWTESAPRYECPDCHNNNLTVYWGKEGRRMCKCQNGCDCSNVVNTLIDQAGCRKEKSGQDYQSNSSEEGKSPKPKPPTDAEKLETEKYHGKVDIIKLLPEIAIDNKAKANTEKWFKYYSEPKVTPKKDKKGNDIKWDKGIIWYDYDDSHAVERFEWFDDTQAKGYDKETRPRVKIGNTWHGGEKGEFFPLFGLADLLPELESMPDEIINVFFTEGEQNVAYFRSIGLWALTAHKWDVANLKKAFAPLVGKRIIIRIFMDNDADGKKLKVCQALNQCQIDFTLQDYKSINPKIHSKGDIKDLLLGYKPTEMEPMSISELIEAINRDIAIESGKKIVYFNAKSSIKTKEKKSSNESLFLTENGNETELSDSDSIGGGGYEWVIFQKYYNGGKDWLQDCTGNLYFKKKLVNEKQDLKELTEFCIKPRFNNETQKWERPKVSAKKITEWRNFCLLLIKLADDDDRDVNGRLIKFGALTKPTKAMIDRETINAHLKGRLKFNELSLFVELDGKTLLAEGIQQTLMDMGINTASEKTATDAIFHLARKNSYCPIHLYLDSNYNSKKPTNTNIIDSIATRYFGTNNHLYDKMVRAFLIAAVARVYEYRKPGFNGSKVDNILVLQSKEAQKKSTFFRTLASKPFFSDSMGAIDGPNKKDEIIKVHKVWMNEWGELERVFGEKSESQVKMFVTQEYDDLRLPYGKDQIRLYRKSVFVATTNKPIIYPTFQGGRRLFIIPLQQKIDTDLLERERDDIWAAAVLAYKQGEQWWLEDDLMDQIRELSKEFAPEDLLGAQLESYLESKPIVKLLDVMKELEFSIKDRGLYNQEKVKNSLKELGYFSAVREFNGKRQRVWVRSDQTPIPITNQDDQNPDSVTVDHLITSNQLNSEKNNADQNLATTELGSEGKENLQKKLEGFNQTSDLSDLIHTQQGFETPITSKLEVIRSDRSDQIFPFTGKNQTNTVDTEPRVIGKFGQKILEDNGNGFITVESYSVKPGDYVATFAGIEFLLTKPILKNSGAGTSLFQDVKVGEPVIRSTESGPLVKFPLTVSSPDKETLIEVNPDYLPYLGLGDEVKVETVTLPYSEGIKVVSPVIADDYPEIEEIDILPGNYQLSPDSDHLLAKLMIDENTLDITGKIPFSGKGKIEKIVSIGAVCSKFVTLGINAKIGDKTAKFNYKLSMSRLGTIALEDGYVDVRNIE